MDGASDQHPLECVRGHAEAIGHANPFDPRKLSQVRALASGDRDARPVDLPESEHVGARQLAASSVRRHIPFVIIHSLLHIRRPWALNAVIISTRGVLAAIPPPRSSLGTAGNDRAPITPCTDEGELMSPLPQPE